MGNVYQPVDPGAAGHRRLDWGEVEHHIGGAGQLLQYRITERRADKVDVGVQVVVWVGGGSGDPMPSGDQLPGHGTPKLSGDASQQDPHA
jgi:hypothetical protein